MGGIEPKFTLPKNFIHSRSVSLSPNFHQQKISSECNTLPSDKSDDVTDVRIIIFFFQSHTPSPWNLLGHTLPSHTQRNLTRAPKLYIFNFDKNRLTPLFPKRRLCVSKIPHLSSPTNFPPSLFTPSLPKAVVPNFPPLPSKRWYRTPPHAHFPPSHSFPPRAHFPPSLKTLSLFPPHSPTFSLPQNVDTVPPYFPPSLKTLSLFPPHSLTNIFTPSKRSFSFSPRGGIEPKYQKILGGGYGINVFHGGYGINVFHGGYGINVSLKTFSLKTLTVLHDYTHISTLITFSARVHSNHFPPFHGGNRTQIYTTQKFHPLAQCEPKPKFSPTKNFIRVQHPPLRQKWWRHRCAYNHAMTYYWLKISLKITRKVDKGRGGRPQLHQGKIFFPALS